VPPALLASLVFFELRSIILGRGTQMDDHSGSVHCASPGPAWETMIQRHRNPIVWLLLIVLTVALGIGSRRFPHRLPVFVADLRRGTPSGRWRFSCSSGWSCPERQHAGFALLAMGALGAGRGRPVCYRAPWIDSIRRTTVGGLILGYGFLWSDLVCYAAGVGLGALAEAALVRFSRRGPVAG